MHNPCWLLYEDADYEANQDFVRLITSEGKKRGLAVVPVLRSQLTMGVGTDGRPCALVHGSPGRPVAVLSRQRDHRISAQLEAMGIPVFNNATVCQLCNDKRNTYQFLHGLPRLRSEFLAQGGQPPFPPASPYPLVLKPSYGHGGDRVALVHNEEEWQAAAHRILPQAMIQQEVASTLGQDLRVYVVFGQIVAAVMRTAPDGFLSNFKRGGRVALHALAQEERLLALQVIRRFQDADAPLCLAGIDFLFHHGKPVVSEVEDVVGSRMLYHVSDINIAGLFLDGVQRSLKAKN